MNTARIEDLKRRIQRDPASIAFAQLSEEFRRAGRFREAVETCRAGLEHHPGYLSARVTLGRSLMALGDLAAATQELQEVLRLAPENLSALRCLADIARRGGNNPLARFYLEQATALAPRDPELLQLLQAVQDDPARAPQLDMDPRASAEARELAAALQGPPPPTSRSRRVIAVLERWHDGIRAYRART